MERTASAKAVAGLAPTLLVLLAVALAGASGTGAQVRPDAATARPAAGPAPVASLEPAATAALWRRLVERGPRRADASAQCRPVRALFYAATDYLRLATKLAATPSPCAEYYVSIPPLVADKTRPRPNAAWRVRALGPNFHAMAEFHFTTWNRWVQSTGSTWYEAGITARQRMAEAGYDMAQGDIWVLNELSSAVRRGTGNARANVRELLRGLYEGSGQPVRGAVFVIGVGQRTSDVSLYQTNLQNWFTDTAFWADMATYVSDWAQEVYGDVRSYAVPGVPTPVRRDSLSDYLHHKLVLAEAGPASVETARSFLRGTFGPLANAAWERETGYGWTMVPSEQMGAYVSGQVHALRHFGATSGQTQERWGFAWAPRNGSGLPADEFTAQTGLILDRLGAAIRDSAESADPADPGGGACGPPGQNRFCVVDVEGARLNEAWRSFRSWTQPTLAFSTPAQTIAAGAPSAAMGLALVTSSGLAVTTPVPLTVTVGSSSPTGAFAPSVEGPWTPTLTLAIAAGTRTTAPFHYRDTTVGAHVLTAGGPGLTSGTQPVTVIPAQLVGVVVSPVAASVPARGSTELAAAGTDAFGNVFPVTATWSQSPRSGVLRPGVGATTTFIARRALGRVTVTARVATGTGTVSGTAGLRVTPGRLRVREISYRIRKRTVVLTLRVADLAGDPISKARASIVVRRDGRRYAPARGETGASGRIVIRLPVPRRGGCLVTTVRGISAPGFVWDRRTPRNRLCRPRS